MPLKTATEPPLSTIVHSYVVGPDTPEATAGVWASAGEAAEVNKASRQANDCGCHGQHFSVCATTVKPGCGDEMVWSLDTSVSVAVQSQICMYI